jgi:hypothetical protein
VKCSIFLSSGFAQEFVRIPDPVTTYDRWCRWPNSPTMPATKRCSFPTT